MKDRTRVIHPPEVELPPGNKPLVAPLYQSVKFETRLPDGRSSPPDEQGGEYAYSRVANPTTRQLEELIAAMQGRDACVVSGSGLAALGSCLLALCKAGDHILCFAETYGPTLYLVRRLMARFGIAHTLLSVEDDAGIERVLRDRPTRLVVFESPTNPLVRVADIGRITRAARDAGALTVLDNTFAGLHNHGQFPVDLFVHSLTKYASGHGDVMGGAVVGERQLIDTLRREAIVLGAVLDPHAAFLVLRGLKTYYLRYDAQAAAATRIAQWLAAHPAVAEVHYPGLASHSRHALACVQMRDFGTVIALRLAGGAQAARNFAAALRLFALAPSVGSIESLVLPPGNLRPRGMTAAERALCGVTDATVRLSIGAEDPEDLIADLDGGLTPLGV